MANEEHLAWLKKGVLVWDVWRIQHPNTVPDLSGADLFDRNFNLMGLSEANLSKANLGGTRLSGANLSGAYLHGVNFTAADFSVANLAGANFTQANLSMAKFHKTILGGAVFSESKVGPTIFSDVDLSQVKGLGSVVHEHPSSIGVDTLVQTLRGSGGRFTGEQVEFFLGAGVPQTLLEYLPSILESNPVQFYQCFISYSHLNEAFATPLNQDLNEVGIKTWKWDRDAVRGRDLAQNIDHAIHSHDKTILICSVSSLTSPQVEREIQTALDKEIRIKAANAERAKEALARGEPPPYVDADVLFPIRIDNTIFQWTSHLKGEVARRMVADFTNAPPGSEKYQRELQTLIESLNPKSWPPGVKLPPPKT